MKPRAIVLGVLVVVGLGVAGFGIYQVKHRGNSAAQSGGGGEAPPQTVTPAEVTTIQWRPLYKLSGTVFPLQWITLSTEVAGTIDKVMFESGSIVEPGAVLLTLESSSQQADLATAEAGLRVSEASVRVAEASIKKIEADLAKYRKAFESKAASAADVDRLENDKAAAQASIDRARADVEASRARVAQLRTMLDKRVLKAPFKGRVGLRNIHPGQYLKEGGEVVGLQAYEDQTFLDFAVPQEFLARVKVGEVFPVEAPIMGPGKTDITVHSIDAVADYNTRNIRVRGIVADPQHKLRPGMSVDIAVPIDELKPYTVVPVTAIRRASYGDHVYMIVPDEKNPSVLRAKQQFVKLGLTLGDVVIVKEGLKPGDKVAGAGSFKLMDNVMVMLAAPTPAPAAAKPQPGSTAAADSQAGKNN